MGEIKTENVRITFGRHKGELLIDHHRWQHGFIREDGTVDDRGPLEVPE